MVVLDTNVISELMRPSPSTSVSKWIAGQLSAELYTTAISESEIFFEIELIAHGKRRDGLLAAAEKLFSGILVDRVLAFDSSAARAYAILLGHRRRLGRPMGNLDAQIAAIAQAHGATVATRNLNHFESCGIRLVNPWDK